MARRTGSPYFGKTKVLARDMRGYEAEAAITCDDEGGLHIGVKIKNDEVYYIVDIPLKTIMYAALNELKTTVGQSPQAQTVVSALVDMGRQLSSIARTPPPVPDEEAGTNNRDLAIARRFAPTYKVR